jgi:uncharacterized damage-inducible protein DinB
MTETSSVTREDLLRELRDSGERVASTVRGLPETALEAGVYESGWSGREVLAHIAAMEWAYPKLVDQAQAVRDDPGAAAEMERPPTDEEQERLNSYNQRRVDKLADRSVAQLLEEFERNRAATIARIEGMDNDLLALPVRPATGHAGPLGEVMRYVAVEHVLTHLSDLTGVN